MPNWADYEVIVQITSGANLDHFLFPKTQFTQHKQQTCEIKTCRNVSPLTTLILSKISILWLSYFRFELLRRGPVSAQEYGAFPGIQPDFIAVRACTPHRLSTRTETIIDFVYERGCPGNYRRCAGLDFGVYTLSRMSKASESANYQRICYVTYQFTIRVYLIYVFSYDLQSLKRINFTQTWLYCIC